MTGIKVQPDKKYDLGYIDTRFSVPAEWMPPTAAQIKACSYDIIKQTINQMERLRHWQHYDKMPVAYRLSPLQADHDAWASTSKTDIKPAADVTIKGKEWVYFTARVWFVREALVLDSEQLAEEARQANRGTGFVNYEDMPEGALPTKRIRINAGH